MSVNNNDNWQIIKEWKKLIFKIERKKTQCRFLYRCKKYIFPNHIINNSSINIELLSKEVCNKVEKSLNFFNFKILNFEILDINQEISFLQEQIENFKSRIISWFSQPFYNNLLQDVQLSLAKYIKLTVSTAIKKFDNLKVNKKLI